MAQKAGQQDFLHLLEQTVNNSCLCKLREHCPDKSAPECLKDKNIYLNVRAAMQADQSY